MIDVSRIKGVTAPEWEKKGKTWDPSLQFTAALADRKYVSEVNQVLAAHGDKVAAYYLYEPLPGGFSLELQFKTKAAAEKARTMWQAFDRSADNDDDEEDFNPLEGIELEDVVPPVVFDDANTHQFLLVYNLKRIRFTLAAVSVKNWFEQAKGFLAKKKITDDDMGTLVTWRELKRAMDNDAFKTEDDQGQIAGYLSYIALASREYRMHPSFRHYTFQIFDDLSHPDVDHWGDCVDHDEENDHAFLALACDVLWPLDDLEAKHHNVLHGVEQDDED